MQTRQGLSRVNSNQDAFSPKCPPHRATVVLTFLTNDTDQLVKTRPHYDISWCSDLTSASFNISIQLIYNMASSQPATSSPARSAASQDDRFALSPQSRLKKLLAAVDSESDDENSPTAAVRQRQSSRHESPSKSHANVPAPVSSDDEDEDDVIRPRGRLAAQIQGRGRGEEADAVQRVRRLLEKDVTGKQDSVAATADVDGGANDSDDDLVRPRGRLASRMQGGQMPPENDTTNRASKSPSRSPAPGQPTDDAEDVEMADDDGDEDFPVRARKLKPRRRITETPEPTSTTRQKSTSPGLFVTPNKSPVSAQESPAAGSGSDDDLPDLKSNRFKALVEKKRRERLAREAEEARKKEARAAALEDLGDDHDDDVSDITDDEGGRKLTQTQKPRPSRKASKKALEDMNRETQRMQRAMQLAHEAKTKKKITKELLFERFNFKAAGSASAKEAPSRPQTPVSTKSTDAEMQDVETPPSSPPARVEDVLGKDMKPLPTQSGAAAPMQTETSNDATGQDDYEELPDIMDIQFFARKPLDTRSNPARTPVKAAQKRQVRVKLPAMQANRVSLSSGDEDDLVVVDTKKSKLDAVFDRIPKDKARESSSLRLLRRLAHLDSPERKAHKKTDKSAMTAGELQALLQQRAREQARLERQRRMEMLKAKGVHIQTEEERERDREQIEDMVARARREAEEIMDREVEEAKQEKKAGGGDPLAWDESGSEDGDYENSDADDAEDEADVRLSGSEDENEGDEEDNEEERIEGMIIDGDDDKEEASAEAGPGATPKKTHGAQNLVHEAADETSESEGSETTERSWVDPDEEEEQHRWGAESDADTPAFVQARRPKMPLPISSDGTDADVDATPRPTKTQFINSTPRPVTAQAVDFTTGLSKDISPEVPTSVLRSATKTFIPGLPVDVGGPAGLGLTQIFAGTMDDSQADAFQASPSQPMPTFDHFAAESQISQNASDEMVLDSQTVPATQADTQDTQVQLDFTQSQMHGLDSLLRDDFGSQPSQLMNPTQDGGFQTWTPLKERFVEPPMSTVETVVHDPSQVDEMIHDSPLQQKRGRLRRKVVIASDSEDDNDFGVGTKPSAFNILRNAAAKEEKRKAREEFNKKKSKAKEMVHEQAEESEDEYAGLGGVDGEDSEDDDAASVQEMIDDQNQGNREEDEAKISALYA